MPQKAIVHFILTVCRLPPSTAEPLLLLTRNTSCAYDFAPVSFFNWFPQDRFVLPGVVSSFGNYDNLSCSSRIQSLSERTPKLFQGIFRKDTNFLPADFHPRYLVSFALRALTLSFCGSKLNDIVSDIVFWDRTQLICASPCSALHRWKTEQHRDCLFKQSDLRVESVHRPIPFVLLALHSRDWSRQVSHALSFLCFDFL